MNEKKLTTWEDFEVEVAEVFSIVGMARKEKGTYVSSPLFRGHADDSWRLSTRLERFATRPYLMKEYHRLFRAVQPAVLTFSSNVPTLSEWDQEQVDIPSPPPGYEFRV